MKRIFLFLLLIVPCIHAMDIETAKALKACSDSVAHELVKFHDSIRYGSMDAAMNASENAAIRWLRNHTDTVVDSSILRHAVQKKYINLARILLERGAQIVHRGPGAGGTITDAIGWYFGNNDMLKLLLSKNQHTKQALTDALFYAITQKPECVPVLLEHGADVNAHEQHWPHNSPLWKALYWFYWIQPNTINALLKHGADVNEISCEGDTPLMSVIKDPRKIPEKDREEFVKLLSLHGADWSIKNGKGKTALDYAQGNIKKLLSDPLMIECQSRLVERRKKRSPVEVELVFPLNWNEKGSTEATDGVITTDQKEKKE